MDFINISLCKTLDQYDKIIIYGTGVYAHEIYPYLIEYGLKKKILCFTQTVENEVNLLDEIPVFNIKKLVCYRKDCVVLVAVNKLYEDEIRQTLAELQYSNVIYLTNYIIYPNNSEEIFLKLTSFDEYCEVIANWYEKTHTDTSKKERIIQKLLDKGKYYNRKRDPNLIVIICGHISIRSNKIISALKRKGYSVIILDYCVTKHTWCIKGFEKAGGTIYECNCIEEMLYNALKFNPLVYYFEPRWADCSWVEIMLRQKEYFGKIVLTLYDVANDGYFIQVQRRLDMERYSLENADGIVWRWFSKEHLEKKGFSFKGKSIQFLDYCSREKIVPADMEVPSKVLKLCFVLGWDAFFVTKRNYVAKYRSVARLNEILEKIGNRKDCIFHFYIGRLNEEWIEICKQYELQYQNFKFFLNTERDELLLKLQSYDYGCNLCTEGEWPPDDEIVDNATGSYMKNCIRNTFFDYLSSGLPIIATMPLRLLEYLQQYNVIIDMDITNFDIDYLIQNKDVYKENVRVAVKELDIDNQITRLINFFQNV